MASRRLANWPFYCRRIGRQKNKQGMTEFAKESWADFIVGFCKVEFLCYGGDPNWLGYIIVFSVGGVLLLLTLLLLIDCFRCWWRPRAS
jgi:hypothetical protein